MSLFDGKKAALFDLGGTLIIYESQSWLELLKIGVRRAYTALAEHGNELPEVTEIVDGFADYLRQANRRARTDHREISFHDECRRFLARYSIEDSDTVGAFVEDIYAPVAEQLEPAQGNVAALEFVRSRGLKVGLVSNSMFPARWHLDEMNRFGIGDYFDVTVFSIDHGMRKPDKSIFLDCLESLGVAPSEAFHVGDRPIEDIGGANSLGMTSVLIKRDDLQCPENIKPDYAVDKVGDIISL